MSFFQNARQQLALREIEQKEGQTIEQQDFQAPSPVWGNYGFPIRFNIGLGLQQSTSDQTLLWSLTAPTSFYPNTDMGLSFGKQTMVITGLPNLNALANYLYIAIDGFNGYANINGVVTTNVVKYGLSDVIFVNTPTPTYTAKYKSEPIDWILPYTMQTLNFRLYYEDNTTAETCPLDWQFGFQFMITRTPFDRRFGDDYIQEGGFDIFGKMFEYKSMMF